MSTPNDILNGGTPAPLPEEQLMAYLEGRLTAEEAHAVEAWLAEEGMESDALEGLQQTGSTQAKHSVRAINRALRKKIGVKRQRGRYLKGDRWALIAILLILVLAIVAYAVIHFAAKK